MAVAVHSVGELWQAAASFTLSFDLAQEHAHGQYQAVYTLGEGIERALAPTILGVLCIAWGAVGWLILGTLLALAGALMPAVVRNAERRIVTVPAHAAGELSGAALAVSAAIERTASTS
jgi:hypothetical protein